MRILIPILLVLAVIIGLNSLFVVKETEYAIKFRLGEVVRADYEPGLHLKMPFINNVVKLERRLITLDMQPEQMNTAEQKFVEVDYYVKWQITDPRQFYVSTQGGDMMFTRSRLGQLIRNDLRDEFAQRTLSEVVSEQRRTMMERLVARADERFQDFGIDVIDVRIKRIELTEQVLNSVFDRMETQRTEYANELRSLGRESAERIRADADRQVRVLLAEAEREAQQIRGEGDAQAIAIYADAFNRDREFYSFWRSLGAYENSFGTESDILLMDTSSEFFRFFEQQDGR
ncbi:protease modulator HflC [Wenzhouxiangella marina]|uniref:Protein HflC n=1 Tax=Wenzhouxiangella marina TaxID=1579979 RepID=A0A0K0XVI1_9GAMM|nr:protease modulator HflC [Wenzhouxiangella marina]AKS41693.1 Protein HflC [Wenzhouxiangella marina]MBB6086546.1 membrane protease subunit HflC [Wenzhouxiangella marina]